MMFLKIICFGLFLNYTLFAEEKKIIYEQSLAQEQTRKFKNRLEKSKEARSNADLPDFKSKDTSQLVEEAIFYGYGELHFESLYEEIQKRPIDEIEQKISLLLETRSFEKSLVPILLCLKVSDIVGPEFKTQVGEHFLFKPGSKRMDVWFFGEIAEGKFFNYLSAPEIDQSYIIDQLVAEGRLKKNTREARRLRSQLNISVDRIHLIEKVSPSDYKQSKFKGKPRSLTWLYWVLGALILGGVGVLVWNSRKGSSAR